MQRNKEVKAPVIILVIKNFLIDSYGRLMLFLEKDLIRIYQSLYHLFKKTITTIYMNISTTDRRRAINEKLVINHEFLPKSLSNQSTCSFSSFYWYFIWFFGGLP